jgi:hypothetical protein
MKLFTKEIEKALAANASADESTRRPVLKLFGGGACTWLISERVDDDTLFGLCDLGMGCPELGYVSQSELEGLRFPPLGLPIERDLYFTADKTLSEYFDESRESGRIAA